MSRPSQQRESWTERVATRLLVGNSDERASFLIRHDWAIPTVVFAGCGLFGAGTLWLTWIGWGRVVFWIWVAIMALTVLLLACLLITVTRATRGPLPALDRTPRAASVALHAHDGDGRQDLLVRFRGADGQRCTALLADSIHEISRERFSPGSRWQVYAFCDPALAETVVFLTEAHDDVWRDGYVLDGVRIGGESGPLKPQQGSAFLREDGKWRFERAGVVERD